MTCVPFFNLCVVEHVLQWLTGPIVYTKIISVVDIKFVLLWFKIIMVMDMPGILLFIFHTVQKCCLCNSVPYYSVLPFQNSYYAGEIHRHNIMHDYHDYNVKNYIWPNLV